MPTKRIVNTSPLILLTKIGRIDLLDADVKDTVIADALKQAGE